MNKNAVQYLHQWKKKQDLRKQQNTSGIFYKIQHNLSGSIKIEATITPEAMATALIVAESFHLAVIDATTTIQSQHVQAEKERLEYENMKIEYQKSERTSALMRIDPFLLKNLTHPARYSIFCSII